MALDHPVVNLTSGRWLPHSRMVELAVVVVLTVAVVVVAAVWESSSDEIGPGSVTSLDSAGDARSNPAVAATSRSGDDGVTTTAPVETEGSSLSTISEAGDTEHDPTELAIQAGIVREIPDFGGRLLPYSFERYQVQRGETLSSIASDRSLTISELLLWNLHLDEDSVLIPGEWLSIPEWSASAVADEPGPEVDDGKSGRGGG